MFRNKLKLEKIENELLENLIYARDILDNSKTQDDQLMYFIAVRDVSLKLLIKFFDYKEAERWEEIDCCL